MSVIGRRGKHIVVFSKTQTPGIIAGVGHKLKAGNIWFETIHSLAELSIFSRNGSFKSRVTHYAPYLIVITILKIRWTCMSIKGAPAINDHFLYIGFIIAIGIF